MEFFVLGCVWMECMNECIMKCNGINESKAFFLFYFLFFCPFFLCRLWMESRLSECDGWMNGNMYRNHLLGSQNGKTQASDIIKRVLQGSIKGKLNRSCQRYCNIRTLLTKEKENGAKSSLWKYLKFNYSAVVYIIKAYFPVKIT